jgi:hypothetical protein
VFPSLLIPSFLAWHTHGHAHTPSRLVLRPVPVPCLSLAFALLFLSNSLPVLSFRSLFPFSRPTAPFPQATSSFSNAQRLQRFVRAFFPSPRPSRRFFVRASSSPGVILRITRGCQCRVGRIDGPAKPSSFANRVPRTDEVTTNRLCFAHAL